MKAEVNLDTQELVKDVTEAVLKALEPTLKGNGEGDTLFTVKTLAKYLEVSEQWVYERVQQNEIPFVKMGKHLRFKKSDIMRWLDSLNTPAMTPFSGSLRTVT
jgi:excisionase family DNA binding protein